MIHARVFILTCFCVASWVLTAEAHGPGNHILGTVTAISDTEMSVQTQKGESLSVRLTDKTAFRSRGKEKETAGTRPQVGDRVVIDATGKGAQLTATEVLFASAKDKAKAPR